jgi:hypothetical protein
MSDDSKIVNPLENNMCKNCAYVCNYKREHIISCKQYLNKEGKKILCCDIHVCEFYKQKGLIINEKETEERREFLRAVQVIINAIQDRNLSKTDYTTIMELEDFLTKEFEFESIETKNKKKCESIDIVVSLLNKRIKFLEGREWADELLEKLNDAVNTVEGLKYYTKL